MSPSLSTTRDERCAECGQFHLVEGYCQALDPRNPWHRNEAMQALARRHGARGSTLKAVTENPESVTPVTDVTDFEPETVTPVGERICAEVDCERSLPSERPNAVYCSGACRKRAQRRKSEA